MAMVGGSLVNRIAEDMEDNISIKCQWRIYNSADIFSLNMYTTRIIHIWPF